MRPWVPLPEPGAPNNKIVRYFIACLTTDFPGIGVPGANSLFRILRRRSSVLMPNRDLADLRERDRHFRGRAAFVELKYQFFGLKLADAMSDILTARRLDIDHHVFLRVAGHHPQETGELGFKEPPVEHCLA